MIGKATMAKRKGKSKRIQHHEPKIQHQEPPLDDRDVDARGDRRFWPADTPLPTVYVKPAPRQIPCRACRRVLLDDLGQAVVCTSSREDVAYFLCRGCGERFKMMVRLI